MTPTATPPKKRMSLSKKILVGLGAIILIALIANLDKDNKNPEKPSSSNQKENTLNEAESTSENNPTIGETLKTEYFQVTINKVKIDKNVSTGNEFADVKSEQGNKFLILNTTFKNIDNESRMLTDGELYITYNGKEYTFDKSETIMLEGWGLMLDQINPLITKTTNIVYQIPEEINGPAYYKPGRADGDEKIFIGNLK